MRGRGWVIRAVGLLVLVVAVLIPGRAAAASAPAAALGPAVTALTMAAAPAECYRWTRTLRVGMRGRDVASLQVRVAGWTASHSFVAENHHDHLANTFYRSAPGCGIAATGAPPAAGAAATWIVDRGFVAGRAVV